MGGKNALFVNSSISYRLCHNFKKKKLNVSSEVVKKKYYSNGKVKSIIPYKNNLIDGIVKHYYENGNLKSELLYRNGIEENILKTYDENGEILEKLEKFEFFYPNGNIETRYYFIVNKKLGTAYQNGPDEQYYENGNLKSRSIYKNGEIEGYTEHFYENGNLESRIPLSGIAEFYYENGNLQSKYYVDETHMENIGFWNEDGKEDELMNTYNKIMREVYKKSRRD